MPFAATPSPNYGGPLVTQKYAPLQDIQLDKRADRDACRRLFTDRDALLRGRGFFPCGLTLTADWQQLPVAEFDCRPPLVVISSGRAVWIAQGLANAAIRETALTGAPLAGVADLRALSDAQMSHSPPLYAPERIGTQRNVYLVVHERELAEYRTALSDAGVQGVSVVGWAFARLAGKAASLVGFGATRFAAIAFCKELRAVAAAHRPAQVAALARNAAQPLAAWDFAWLLDDNVVAFTAFDTLQAVEGALQAAVAKNPDTACAGLHGGTEAEARQAQQAWAAKEVVEKRGKATGALGALKDPPNILQQAVLWNIEALTRRNRNFSPLFFASGEDLSFTRYLEASKTPYLFYDGMKVVKEAASNAPGKGGRAVNQARLEFERGVAALDLGSGDNREHPVLIGKGAEALPLADFITNRVMPNSQLADIERQDPACLNRARCQAVEQLMIKAIAHGVLTADVLQPFFEIRAADAPITRTQG